MVGECVGRGTEIWKNDGRTKEDRAKDVVPFLLYGSEIKLEGRFYQQP